MSFTEQRFFELLNSLEPHHCFQASWGEVVEAAWTEQSSRLYGQVGEAEVTAFLRKLESTHQVTARRNHLNNTFTICRDGVSRKAAGISMKIEAPLPVKTFGENTEKIRGKAEKEKRGLLEAPSFVGFGRSGRI